MTEKIPVPEFRPGELRDRLANERTLLAWVRTALTLMAFGVGVAKLPDPDSLQLLVGATLVFAGGAVAGVGAWRSRLYASFIDPEGKPPSNVPVALSAGFTAVFSLVIIAYMFATHP